jgi:hypothetical protein
MSFRRLRERRRLRRLIVELDRAAGCGKPAPVRPVRLRPAR